MVLPHRPPRKPPQARNDEHMEGHQRRRRVAREGEYGHLALRRRDGGERRRLPWLHLDPPEMDRPVQMTLDDRLQQVARAHARPARRDYYVRDLETFLQGSDVVLKTMSRH